MGVQRQPLRDLQLLLLHPYLYSCIVMKGSELKTIFDSYALGKLRWCMQGVSQPDPATKDFIFQQVITDSQAVKALLMCAS